MNKIEKYSLPIEFPDNLLQKGIELESIGINEIGWEYEYVITVIEFICSRNYAILGGDVYSVKDNHFESTYDNWYLDKDEKITWEEYVKSSKQKTLSYINNYHSKNKDGFIFVLVYTPQPSPSHDKLG